MGGETRPGTGHHGRLAEGKYVHTYVCTYVCTYVHIHARVTSLLPYGGTLFSILWELMRSTDQNGLS